VTGGERRLGGAGGERGDRTSATAPGQSIIFHGSRRGRGMSSTPSSTPGSSHQQAGFQCSRGERISCRVGCPGQLQIRGRWQRRAAGMAVGRTQHLQTPLARPALGQQLLTRIEPEAPCLVNRRLPHIQTGPDQPDLKDRRSASPAPDRVGSRHDGGSGSGPGGPRMRVDRSAGRASQQQSTSFARHGGDQHPAQNRQLPPTDVDLPWHRFCRIGTLGRFHLIRPARRE